MARLLGMSLQQLSALERHDRARLAEVNRDDMYTTMAEAVDTKLAELLGVREELNRKLAEDRKRQVLRRAMTRGR